jgi:hypothetical protein
MMIWFLDPPILSRPQAHLKFLLLKNLGLALHCSVFVIQQHIILP